MQCSLRDGTAYPLLFDGKECNSVVTIAESNIQTDHIFRPPLRGVYTAFEMRIGSAAALIPFRQPDLIEKVKRRRFAPTRLEAGGAAVGWDGIDCACFPGEWFVSESEVKVDVKGCFAGCGDAGGQDCSPPSALHPLLAIDTTCNHQPSNQGRAIISATQQHCSIPSRRTGGHHFSSLPVTWALCVTSLLRLRFMCNTTTDPRRLEDLSSKRRVRSSGKGGLPLVIDRLQQ